MITRSALSMYIHKFTVQMSNKLTSNVKLFSGDFVGVNCVSDIGFLPQCLSCVSKSLCYISNSVKSNSVKFWKTKTRVSCLKIIKILQYKKKKFPKRQFPNEYFFKLKNCLLLVTSQWYDVMKIDQQSVICISNTLFYKNNFIRTWGSFLLKI